MTKRIACGNLFIGGDAPVTIQSMVTKNTHDIEACVNQIKALVGAGCEIVRLAVPDGEAAVSFGKIKENKVVIESLDKKMTKGKATKKISVKYKPTFFSRTIEKVSKNEKVI